MEDVGSVGDVSGVDIDDVIIGSVNLDTVDNGNLVTNGVVNITPIPPPPSLVIPFLQISPLIQSKLTSCSRSIDSLPSFASTSLKIVDSMTERLGVNAGGGGGRSGGGHWW